MYWIVLIAGAILALIYVVVKIRHNQLATSDAVFWFLLAGCVFFLERAWF